MTVQYHLWNIAVNAQYVGLVPVPVYESNGIKRHIMDLCIRHVDVMNFIFFIAARRDLLTCSLIQSLFKLKFKFIITEVLTQFVMHCL